VRYLVKSIPALALMAASLVGCGDQAPAAAASCGGGLEVTLNGTAGDDMLSGTPGRDVIDGRAGNDTIDGLGGDDVLCGGAGMDTVSGGPGDDLVDGGADVLEQEDIDYYVWHGDTIMGGDGNDVLIPGTSRDHDPVDILTFADATHGVRVDLIAGTASGEGEDRISGPLDRLFGTAFDDRLLGSEGADDIDAGAGSDFLDGRDGDDFLQGGQTFDRADQRPNTVIGGGGDDEIHGAEGDDLLRGGDGNDLLQGMEGVDRSYGGAGDDMFGDAIAPGTAPVLDGGAGEGDTLGDIRFYRADGQEVDDAVGTIDLAREVVEVTYDGVSTILDSPGFENATSPRGSWTLIGTSGPNELSAGFLDESVVIHAGAGDDTLAGSDQRDLLDGGPGQDSAGPSMGDDAVVSIENLRQ
jgi:Ca2+-binding RTX toxin-like protein